MTLSRDHSLPGFPRKHCSIMQQVMGYQKWYSEIFRIVMEKLTLNKNLMICKYHHCHLFEIHLRVTTSPEGIFVTIIESSQHVLTAFCCVWLSPKKKANCWEKMAKKRHHLREKNLYGLPVVPGQAGGGSFQKEKNYIAKKEFAYRMCARRPTSAMPKSFLFLCSPSAVPWWRRDLF